MFLPDTGDIIAEKHRKGNPDEFALFTVVSGLSESSPPFPHSLSPPLYIVCQ